MTMADLCRRSADRCYRFFPCLSDPARRSSLLLKIALVLLHVLCAGVLFLFDKGFVEKARTEPWYIALYVLLFAVTLIQYFITACSSPGYVIDVMRAVNEQNSLFRNRTKQRQPAPSKSGSFVVSIDGSQSQSGGSFVATSDTTSWAKMVMDLYPPGTSLRACTCSYCNVEQPPRAKHCHDCDRCVLQFDHHCVWLGTCVGQQNHCKFWWYICEETALCLWTGTLYIAYLKAHITVSWWKDIIMIPLLVFMSISLIFLVLLLLFHSYLILSNQTTYELVRRRRIPYMRNSRKSSSFQQGDVQKFVQVLLYMEQYLRVGAAAHGRGARIYVETIYLFGCFNLSLLLLTFISLFGSW